MNLLPYLLPDRSCVRLETWILDPDHHAITLILRARRITACCPLCGRRSRRVHSRYERTLADLPWGTHVVTVRLRVRRDGSRVDGWVLGKVDPLGKKDQVVLVDRFTWRNPGHNDQATPG